MSDQDLEELLQSPYGESSGDTEDTSWKLPVAAAMAGALSMAVFVIFAVVTGPNEDTDPTTSTVPPPPVEAAGFPPGYALVADGVAMRAEVLRSNAEGTTVYVSSAVESGADTGSVAPVEVVSWGVRSPGNDATMTHQLAAKGSLGGVTVYLTSLFDSANATLTAALPDAIEAVEDRLEFPPDLPMTVTDHRISVADSVVVIDELSVDDGFGFMSWHLEGGYGAKVDVVVEFEGTRSPLALMMPHNAPLASGSGSQPLAPLWGPDGAGHLVRDGESLSGSNVPTGITVTFSVSVVVETGAEIEVPVVLVIQD